MTRFAAISMIVAWMGVVVPEVALAASEQTVRCESSARETVRCKADTRGGVVLQRQLSRAGCWYDETWGFDKNGVWVSNGCRADFALGRATASAPPPAAAASQPPSDSGGVAGTGLSGGEIAAGALVIGAIAAAVIASQSNDDDDDDDDDDRYRGNRRNDPWGRDQVVRCESNGKKERYCRASTKRGVELYRQLSKARCRYGSTWGYDRKGIWVDEGCRADFLIRG